MTSFSFSILTFDIIISSESSSIMQFSGTIHFVQTSRSCVSNFICDWHWFDSSITSWTTKEVSLSSPPRFCRPCTIAVYVPDRAWNGHIGDVFIRRSIVRHVDASSFARIIARQEIIPVYVHTRNTRWSYSPLSPTGCYTAKDNILPDIANVCITIDDLLDQRNLSIKELFIFDLSIFVFNRVKIIM